jgi:hypothetical protein
MPSVERREVMGSHMSCIGFPFETFKEFRDLMLRAVENGERIETGRGAYFRWSSGAGAELWAQVYEDGSFGLNPHFAGEAAMHVGITERVERPEAPPLDGAFYCWADPGEDTGPESGLFPLVFDAPDYALYRGLVLPAVVEARISAFAHEITAYPDEEAFRAEWSKFAPGFFIPSGTFKAGGEAIDPPEALAIFGGHVLGSSLLTNPATGAEFWWAKVRNYGGEIEVVADPEDVAGEIVEGGVIKGSFWLSGRLVLSSGNPAQGAWREDRTW